MKIITNEMSDLINKLSENNPEIRDLLSKSNEETFDFSVYKKNRYQVMLNECKEKLTEILNEGFEESGEDFEYKDVSSDQIPSIIAEKMPEQPNILFEMIQDVDFDHTTYVEYEMPNDDLSIHARSFIDECMCNELLDMVDEIWEEIIEKNEENYD